MGIVLFLPEGPTYFIKLQPRTPMHSPISLARRTNNIIAYVTSPARLEQEDIHEEIMHTLQNLQKIFPSWVICTCRFMHQGFFYVSDNARELLGVDTASLANALEVEAYFGRMHHADIEDYSRGLQMVSEIYQEEDPEERHKLRFVFNYRMRHPDGRYIHLHDEKAMLRVRDNLNLYYMLLRDISHETPFAGVKMTCYKEGKRLTGFSASAEATSQLSPREHELLPLMKQGLSTKEIAGVLGISHNTVRNMRQKLFQKFQVNNAIELLNRSAVIDVQGLPSI
jgi:DNA-binding CsgD family transcriptional regulator/PAS domain-containing protein